jgi:hypothetical protein
MRHALAYDLGSRRTVLFGGLDNSAYLGDTWEWDGTNWVARSPAASPPARSAHAMVFDWARQRTVLFGGYSTSGYLGDTWEWDGASWLARSPAASPPARSAHAMVYDAGRQRTVLFGGLSNSGHLGDTWEWDGTNWVAQSAASPPARAGHAMVYDWARRRTVLFGGDLPSTPGWPGWETWEWDGSNWLMRNPASSPMALYGHAMAYDLARQRTVLFGGNLGQPGFWANRDDTWLYGDLVPAATQTIGSACAGTGGLPVLTGGLPALGNQAFVVDLISGRAAAPCIIGLAAATQSLHLGGGCTLYLGQPFTLLASTTNGSGFATVNLAIPHDPTLRGGIAYAQGFVLDPMGSFAGLSFSAGLKLTIGD